MKESDKFVGKTFKHPSLGLVIVDSSQSRVKVNVTCIDRGRGWDDVKQKYVGYKNSMGWMRGQNQQYLHKDIVHINSLEN